MMADNDLNKDNLATQEMMEMMGELSGEISDSLDNLDDIDTDELLSALDNLPSESNAELEPTQVLNSSYKTEDDIDIETIDDLDNLDLDSLMDEENNKLDSKVEIQHTDTDNAVTLDADIDISELNDLADIDMEAIDDLEVSTEDSDALLDDIELPQLDDLNLGDFETASVDEKNEINEPIESETDIDVPLDEISVDELDGIDFDLSSAAKDEMAAEELVKDFAEDSIITDNPEEANVSQELDSPVKETNSSDDDLAIIQYTNDSVSNMEEAIEINQTIHEIAIQAKQTAQEATQLALATSKKAQNSAKQIQNAIEATFVAADRAFEAAKKAGYSIDLSEIEDTNSDEIANEITTIQEKNAHLKLVNESLKARIAKLKE